MLWLTVAISSYLILAVVFLIDKYILTGPIPNPKVYAFYSGVLSVLVLLIIPFIDFYIPSNSQIIISLITGVIFIVGLVWFYKAIQFFETSRVVPAISGILPVFSFLLVYIFSSGKENLSLSEFVAFIMLILGSVLITAKKINFTFKSLLFSSIAAFVFALYFVLTKYVFLEQSFWNGLVWIRIGAIIAALFMLIFVREVKEEIVKKGKFIPQKAPLVVFNQFLGAGGNLMLIWAIFLAPLVYVSIINALQGIQHVFLLMMTVFLSLKFPQILKEEVSKEVLLQKIAAILFIGAGLAILAFL